MAENKTKATVDSPLGFIQRTVDEPRRADCRELIRLMQEVTGQPAKMWGTSIIGFDQYHYSYASGREGDMLLTGFSPRKQELVLYLGESVIDSPLRAKLGTHRVGKGCLYVKRLSDVDHTVLKALIAEAVAAMRQRYGSSAD